MFPVWSLRIRQGECELQKREWGNDICMDTYFHTNGSCMKCGRCVKACNEKGQGFLIGGRGRGAIESSDYVPCHHCDGVWEKKAPCQSVCHYGAISIERW